MTKRELENKLADLNNQFSYLIEKIEDLDSTFDIAESITFENSHDIAHILMTTSELNEAGRALYQELKYYIDKEKT